MTRQRNGSEGQPIPRGRQAVAAALALLATPILVVVADLLRMAADGSVQATGGLGGEGGPAATESMMESIQDNPELFGVAAVLTFAAAFTAVPAVILGWRLGAPTARVMAWAAAVLGVLFVFGRVTHTFTAYGLPLILADQLGTGGAARLYDALNLHWATAMVIVPAIAGIALWFPLLAVALYRSRAIPLWAMVSVLAGTVVLMALGSSIIATPIFWVLTVAGLWPAAASVLGASKARLPERDLGQREPAA
ncbi:hypothetical protein [Arthrobacter wenxiniae]|uniref:DUF4386 family protein n=1 Tax=Arthrobacter wenxiniae TaxID=2713570 RepID=A0A7Y7IEP3_9MICC|nr:hypothetical protein [Arthrobacter wenxiniae]NVM94070.1 hypothetical protein [Arthrobacter wenxiniae]